MPYSYSEVETLEGLSKVGTKQCVVLVQRYARAPAPTSTWTQGALVKGNITLKKGTAIATFEDGKYPNRPHGNHAALYISQNAVGIVVMDQWLDDKAKPFVSKRTIRFKGKDKNGKLVGNSGDNGDAYSVIE